MRKSEMSQEQLRQRSLFVDTLANAGWRGSNTNRNFDEGLWTTVEASLTYSNRDISLELELSFENPRLIFRIHSKEGKNLGLVFRCEDRRKDLVEAIVGMQDNLTADNVKNKMQELVTICPNAFKISASGDKLIPVSPKNSKKKG
jgi:hypothetical protein